MPLRHDLGKNNLESAVDDTRVLLWGHYEFANRRRGQPIDYALEQDWLLHRGIRTKAIELAIARGYIGRESRSLSSHVTTEIIPATNAFLALTEAGAFRAWQIACIQHGGTVGWHERESEKRGPDKPWWEERTGELCREGAVILRVSRRSSFQWMIVNTFQEQSWNQRIENPLCTTKGYRHRRLVQTVKDLNRRQKPARIYFVVEGHGQSVCWHWQG